MQQIKIKEIKGPLGKGEKKFYAVIDEKGAQFTTFDTKVTDLKPGTIIEAEVEVSGKYVNLKEWKVISEPVAMTLATRESPKSYVRDDRELRSIEAQVAFKGIIELACNKVISLDNKYLGYALDWAGHRLYQPLLSAPESKSSPPKEETGSEGFKSVGDLLSWCAKEGISRGKAMEIWQVTDKDLPKINLTDAHQAILDYLIEHPVAKA